MQSASQSNPADPMKGIGPVAEALAGLREISPIALGVAAYALAFGLLAAQAQMDALMTGVMGSIVFAGASQIIAVERLVAGAGSMAALLAGIALNLRFVLITASLRDELAGRPFWQVALGVHLTADENWALMKAARSRGKPVGYWYLVGAGVGLFVAWVTATMCGVVFAQAIPDAHALGLDFAFAAAFIAILRSLWAGPATLMPWLVSIAIVAALTLSELIDPSWALILGGIGGAAFAGFRHDR